MQYERVEKVKTLLASALAKPPEERSAYLSVACAGDLALRREVESYIGSGGRTDRFFYQADTVPDIPIAQIQVESPVPQVTVQVQGDPRIGKEYGKYLIKSRIAEGGMGAIYLAVDQHLGREVALKVLPEFFSADHERLDRFHREARATSLLNHPNIVTVFDIGQVDGCECIVTEFVEGRTLREIMQQGLVPFVETLKIASQIASALAAAHRAGVVHRDIKPENVMLRPDGYVKVLDFGLAKLTDTTRRTASGNVEFGPSDFNRTMPGRIMGTVSHMSPEQAEGSEIDGRTDIWALGVILYEMVSGTMPFNGPTPSHAIVAILEQEPEPLHNASPELRYVVSTALQKDRALRFQTAEAMADAINELKHRLGHTSDKNITGPAPTVGNIAFVPPPTMGIAPLTAGSIEFASPAAGIVAAPTAGNIAVAPPAANIAVGQPAARRSPYRKLLWLVPAVIIVLLVGTVGIYAVVSLILGSLQTGPVRPAANNTEPTPGPTIEANPGRLEPTPSPEPSATPAVIYVDPTPTPRAEPDEPERRSIPPRPVDRRRQPTTEREPVRTPPRPVEAKKPPVKKPKRTQDPNCVFTNSCQ